MWKTSEDPKMLPSVSADRKAAPRAYPLKRMYTICNIIKLIEDGCPGLIYGILHFPFWLVHHRHPFLERPDLAMITSHPE